MIWWVAVLAALGWPAVMLGCLYLFFRGRGRSFPLRRRRRGDIVELCRIVRIGLAGGLNLTGALTMAADRVGPDLAAEVHAMLRRARLEGMAVTLATTGGRLQPFTVQLARAHVTGASLGPALDALISRLETEARGKALEKIRSLPVKLIVPVSLLLLPGFLLVVIAPAAIDQLRSLIGGLGG